MLRNVAGEEHATLIPCLSVICDHVWDLNTSWQSLSHGPRWLFHADFSVLVPSPGYDSWLMTLPTLVLRKLKSTEEESKHLPSTRPCPRPPQLCHDISSFLAYSRMSPLSLLHPYSFPRLQVLFISLQTIGFLLKNFSLDPTSLSSYHPFPLWVSSSKGFYVPTVAISLLSFSLKTILNRHSPYHSTKIALGQVATGFPAAESSGQFPVLMELHFSVASVLLIIPSSKKYVLLLASRIHHTPQFASHSPLLILLPDMGGPRA